ncbi:hypothetical protein PQQ52_33460 [Paraburkholderia sediminicola]|uniref:hypothetical protein n=1 Tax=Paraburkholderia sediminicola TaxID=458836 RepID=UPI0038BD9588
MNGAFWRPLEVDFDADRLGRLPHNLNGRTVAWATEGCSNRCCAVTLSSTAGLAPPRADDIGHLLAQSFLQSVVYFPELEIRDRHC